MNRYLLISISLAASTTFAQAPARMPSFTEPAMEAQNRLIEPMRVVAVLAPSWRLTCQNTVDTCGKLIKATETFVTREKVSASKVGMSRTTTQMVYGEYWEIQITGTKEMRDRIEKGLIKAGFILRPKKE